MKRLRINMIARGVDVPGQGVGSAYQEQVKLLQTHAQDELEIVIKDFKDGDVNHFNTVDVPSRLRLARSQAPSVMHVHFLPDTLDGSIKLPKFAEKIFKRYVLNFYRRADQLVVVNPIFIEPLEKLGIPRERVTYIPNYVSQDLFHVIPNKEQDPTIQKLRKTHQIEDDRFVVLGVGQVQTRKGVKDFVEVAKSMPDMTFVWCGGFSFGNITDGYQELKKLVEDPPANVIFTGIIPREQMNLYYNLADCLFLPSYYELFPMAILEASNARIPLVLRNLELYEDILFGHYRSADSNEGFARILTEMKEQPDARAHQAKETQKIEAFYSADHVKQIWVDYYRRIAQTKN